MTDQTGPLKKITDEFRAKVEAANNVTPVKTKPGEAQCPICSKIYVLPTAPKTPIEREMLITGVCSDACWDKMMGNPEGEVVDDIGDL